MLNMRLSLIALISCLSIGLPAQAFAAAQTSNNTVESLQIELGKVEISYDDFVQTLANLTDQVAQQGAQLKSLRGNGKNLKLLREKALFHMNQQYDAMVDNPDLDIAPAQNAYRQSIIDQKQNKENIKSQVVALDILNADLAQANIDRFTLVNAREALIEEVKIARVKRLRNEFETRDELQAMQTVHCDQNETLKTCISRTVLLAKQKASKEFLNTLYNAATESDLINKHKNNSAARVKLLASKVVSSAFSGQGNYNTNLNVEMQGLLPKNEACTLLNISDRYCSYVPELAVAATEEIISGQASLNDDSVLYQLTVRSDQYDDEIFIDGVSYGSTRLAVMLSSGKHDILINKPGYDDYEQSISLNKNMVIKASLVKASINFANGEKIRDILPGDQLGPELIGIPAGSFQMGDMQGAGLNNEKPARGEQILKAFAIGQNQVTVADFKVFVKETSYVTEAEVGDGCAAFVNGDPAYNDVLNWRNPGFKQTDEHPVVCVSSKDSKAYLTWLSRTTARNYRLPNEKEWEYVARAGSADNYWWGDDIGNGKANCAYCGSKWSNQSTAPVKSFRANKFGLFDTVGNVWELTNGMDIVARGGAWNFAPKLARTSVRLELSNEFRSNYLGFRALREN
jgi:formylglycine-generating enzyme required for sulfatase activity